MIRDILFFCGKNKHRTTNHTKRPCKSLELLFFFLDVLKANSSLQVDPGMPEAREVISALGEPHVALGQNPSSATGKTSSIKPKVLTHGHRAYRVGLKIMDPQKSCFMS